ncbi:hypothetical protein [Tianweitania sediminis]|jgi:hypothetical protein|uniref:Uncharacterized protein n=1 Tax=Tianweitania sediminis TaxID=1502156 RepID=A0A8J7UIH3_9HYPH|nr:hypothetical protein [Tianweitania sediminis]MBP0437654.1 hypothetical protein [Tianweitania sediminis]
MTGKPPPVPPQNQSKSGPGDAKNVSVDDAIHGQTSAANPDKQGQQGNSKVNTTHQGYQQDR